MKFKLCTSFQQNQTLDTSTASHQTGVSAVTATKTCKTEVSFDVETCKKEVSVGVESFADFVMKEIASGIINSVAEKLKQAAQEYIRGEKTAASRLREVYDILLSEGVSVSYPLEDDLSRSLHSDPSLSQSINSADMFTNLSGGEMFEQDLFECFNELLYEYLSRNWNHLDQLIKVNSAEKQEIEEEIMYTNASKNWNALKKTYFRKRTHDSLRGNRVFSTMTAILKSVSLEKNDGLNNHKTTLTSSQPPTIVFLGGGMGAGKSTVVSLLKEQNEGIFNLYPVFIEADALKMIDPVFQALNKLENGANEVSQVVHGYSTDAANKQLLLALRNQRNIVMDGTMTWMPYVQQTLAMIRDAHKNHYRLGPGYINAEGETTTEVYWEVAEPVGKTTEDYRAFQPYRIEMIGVTVDPEKAVARGLRRKLITGRGVPVCGQLRSHRLFTENFEAYMGLMDKTMLFDTSGSGQPQKVAVKESGQPLLQEPSLYSHFLRKKHINENANGVENLYLNNGLAVEFNREGISDKLKEILLEARDHRT